LMSSSSNSHRINARNSSSYHSHQSHLETKSPNNTPFKSEKHHHSSTKKKHKYHRQHSSDQDSDNDNRKSHRTTIDR